ncbi:MAG: SBBP repeat-containing protein [Pirellulales bacterium]
MFFVSVLDNNGDFKWAKNFSGSDSIYSFGIAVDDLGNVYTTGDFSGTIDFNPDTGIANLTSSSTDSFVSALDSSGDYLWAIILGEGSGGYGEAIDVDNAGNLYVLGEYYSTTDFDPGPGVTSLSSPSGVTYVASLDSNGIFRWAESLGGTDEAVASDLAVDRGNIYTTGYFSETADFDPGPGDTNHTAGGSYDIFVSKLRQPNFTLTDVELDFITTTNKIVIGDKSTGDVTFTTPIDLTGNTPLLEINTSGTISDANATDADIKVANLTINGQLSPGQSPGIFSMDGDVTLSNTTSFKAEIDGTWA